jgi:hypothetical protein
MILRSQEYLDALPSHEALEGQGRNLGFGIVIFGWLEAVLASCDLPDVRY